MKAVFGRNVGPVRGDGETDAARDVNAGSLRSMRGEVGHD